MIGFLPLSSYFQTKKNVKSGTKCPSENEDLVRALILKDTLEKLGCTYSKFSEVSKVATAQVSDDIF